MMNGEPYEAKGSHVVVKGEGPHRSQRALMQVKRPMKVNWPHRGELSHGGQKIIAHSAPELIPTFKMIAPSLNVKYISRSKQMAMNILTY